MQSDAPAGKAAKRKFAAFFSFDFRSASARINASYLSETGKKPDFLTLIHNRFIMRGKLHYGPFPHSAVNIGHFRGLIACYSTSDIQHL
jgi:hypothetical protein